MITYEIETPRHIKVKLGEADKYETYTFTSEKNFKTFAELAETLHDEHRQRNGDKVRLIKILRDISGQFLYDFEGDGNVLGLWLSKRIIEEGLLD